MSAADKQGGEGVDDANEHSATTIALAKKESQEQMHGMKELYESMRLRPLTVKAYGLDECADEKQTNVKTVHFVRHGQGFHNLMADMFTKQGHQWAQFTNTLDNPYVMPEILDAPLTARGRQQALSLQNVVKAFENPPELVVLSPNCRALQTGVMVFEEWIGQIPFLAHEMVREESGVHVCDQRRPKSRQEKEFPMVDFSLLETEEDAIFRQDKRETKAEMGERIYKFMEWLSERPEKHIGVASHSAWLLIVFNGFCEVKDEKLKKYFHTGEMRSVKLQFTRKA